MFSEKKVADDEETEDDEEEEEDNQLAGNYTTLHLKLELELGGKEGGHQLFYIKMNPKPHLYPNFSPSDALYYPSLQH